MGESTFKTARLRLRPWKPDLTPYARICADGETRCYMFGGNFAPLSREQSAEQVARSLHRWEEELAASGAAPRPAPGAFPL